MLERTLASPVSANDKIFHVFTLSTSLHDPPFPFGKLAGSAQNFTVSLLSQ